MMFQFNFATPVVVTSTFATGRLTETIWGGDFLLVTIWFPAIYKWAGRK